MLTRPSENGQKRSINRSNFYLLSQQNMSKHWTERNGGVWPSRASVSGKLVYEMYDSTNDAFILVRQRACDGFFEAEYLVKGKPDPQWSLPFWENIGGNGIFETQSDALSNIITITNNHLRGGMPPERSR
jgi:hypothetical protein